MGINTPRVLSDLYKNEAYEGFLDVYEKRRKENPSLPANLDRESLQNGKIRYQDLSNHKSSGIQILSHTHIPESRLKFERNLRVGATATAVAASGAAVYSLFNSGKNLLSSVFGNGDMDEAYNSVGNSMTIGAIAGVANACSHENVNWGLGSLGMGIFGRYLDQPLGLALFSAFDGLNALGMGEVNCRDKKNVTAMPNSIFNHPNLKFLEFLKPHENAVRSFWQKFTSRQGWAKITTDEPYALFQSAAGGLFSGSALLAGASIFSSKMSEGLKSLCYLPYSVTSLLNIVALGRDGMVGKKRADIIDGRKPTETFLMKAEGWFKTLAAPVLASSYGLLGLKAVGINLQEKAEHISMALRTFGVGIASLGFASQSAIKFAVPDLFGPKYKEVFKILMNPKMAMQKLMSLINRVNEQKQTIPPHQSDIFEEIIDNDKFSDLLNRASNTNKFQRLKTRSLTGLPSEFAIDRSILNRYIHSRRVGAIGIKFYNALVQNTTSPNLLSLLQDEDTEAGFKLAGLSHDIGHEALPKSHLAETAVPGLDNDELSYAGLCPGSEIYDEVVKYYIEKHGEEAGRKKADNVLNIAKEIIGHKHWLSKLYKSADIFEYGRTYGGDYNSSFDFPAWEEADYNWFANQRVLFKNQSGHLSVDFAEKGAIIAFKQLYNRLVFNALLNSHPEILASETAYKAGIQNSDLTRNQVFGMTEGQFDEKAQSGVNNLNSSSIVKLRNTFGGEKAYCGYGVKEKINVITQDSNGNMQSTEFLKYLETVIKQRSPEQYNILKPMADVLTNPTLIEMDITMDPNAFTEETSAAQIEEPQIFHIDAERHRRQIATSTVQGGLGRTG